MTIKLLRHDRCIREEACGEFTRDVEATVANGRYDYPASILQYDDPDEYAAQHRTARKRAARARRLGYTVAPIERADHLQEIYEINTSAPERQGRPMSAGYLERPAFSPLPAYGCPRHRIDTFGVFTGRGRLVGYLVLYVCGDLAMISQILGHDAHLRDDVMYLLVTETLAIARRSGPLTVFYNRHDSGTDGLRYFKERLGFQPTRVEWAL